MHTKIDHGVLTDSSWWHWAVTVPLLGAHLGGTPWCIEAAFGLCGVMTAWYWARLRRLRPPPVQIRLAFLGLLALGLLPGMQWVHWVQLAGTTAMVTAGYCPLARLLSLATWNRTEPLTWSLVRRAFLRDPCAGGLVRWSTAPAIPMAACCSIRGPGAPGVCSPGVPPTNGAPRGGLGRLRSGSRKTSSRASSFSADLIDYSAAVRRTSAAGQPPTETEREKR